MRVLRQIAVPAALLAMSALPYAAGATSQDAEATVEAETPEAATRIVCRRMPAPTGSRIGPRNICKTALQWSQIDAENQEIIDRAIRQRPNCTRGGAGTPCGG